MRIAHKLLLPAIVATTALVAIPAAASAEVEVLSESQGTHCPAVTVDVHHVEGGCHVEIASTQPKYIVAFTPAPIVISNCNLHVEARIGEDGSGWVTAAAFTSPDPPTNPPCTRAPCDEVNGTQIPWPFQLSEAGPGEEVGEMTFCMRTVASGPGGAGTQCQLHLPITDLGMHEYQVGSTETTFCENVSNVGVGGAGFAYEGDSEHVEIIH